MPQITLATTGTRILPRNPLRKSLIIQNTDASIAVFVDNMNPEAITTGNASVKLLAGQNISANHNDDGTYQVSDEWSAVAASGTPTLLVKEFF